MLRQSKMMRVWNVFYPILMYFVVTTVVIFILDFILPQTDAYGLLRQLITSAAVIPLLVSYYKKDQKERGMQKRSIHILDGVLCFVAGGCFGIAWNNLLGMIRITDYSSSYSQVTETFYTGKILLEIAALCIIIPIAEELLYRGIVCGRLKDWAGIFYAAIFSALIFGAVHMNLVQFVYASVFGLLLAAVMEKAESILGAIAAHMAANLTSVIRAETDLFECLEKNVIVLAAATVGLFGVSFLCFRYIGRCEKRAH